MRDDSAAGAAEPPSADIRLEQPFFKVEDGEREALMIFRRTFHFNFPSFHRLQNVLNGFGTPVLDVKLKSLTVLGCKSKVKL